MTDWHTRAIIYQIDTALFYDLNGDGCGDIAGIAAKRYDDALICGKTVQLTLGGYGYRWFWMHRSALR